MNIFNRSRTNFTETEEKKIRELLASPELESRLAEVDGRNVAKRAELKRRLDSLDERHDPGIEAAATQCSEAAQKIEALRAQLRQAEEAHRATVAAVAAVEQDKGREDFTTRQALYASRDLRLDQFLVHIGTAHSLVGHCTKTWLRHTGFSFIGQKTHVLESNNAEVIAAMALLKEARKQVESMALLPLTRAEVSERLTAISSEVAPTLKKFSIGWPVLAKDGEVELQAPHANALDVLTKNGVATDGDLPPAESASKARKRELEALAAGSATIGDLGTRRARGARANGGASVAGMSPTERARRIRQEIDDLAN